jgi:hypothetical protein
MAWHGMAQRGMAWHGMVMHQTAQVPAQLSSLLQCFFSIVHKRAFAGQAQH